MLYESGTRKVVVSVWESPSGTFVALSNDWIRDKVASQDLTEALLKEYE